MTAYSRWIPEVQDEVRRLTDICDRRNEKVRSLDRVAFICGRIMWCGSRRSFRRWDRARRNWERALDAWRSVALAASNLTDVQRQERSTRPKGTNDPCISGGWYVTTSVGAWDRDPLCPRT